MTRASDVMRTSLPIVSPGDSLARAVTLMRDFSVREVPVVEREEVVGILARSDLDPHVGHFEWTPVRLAMSSPVRTVAPDATIGQVVRALLEGRFNAIPVVVGNVLAGMITRHDLLQLLIDR